MPDDLPPVTADAEKATWVLNNFLTNAIKYAAGNGTIVLKAIRKNGVIEIGVQDFGSGIDPKFQSEIFDRYFKVPGTKEKRALAWGWRSVKTL